MSRDIAQDCRALLQSHYCLMMRISINGNLRQERLEQLGKIRRTLQVHNAGANVLRQNMTD